MSKLGGEGGLQMLINTALLVRNAVLRLSLQPLIYELGCAPDNVAARQEEMHTCVCVCVYLCVCAYVCVCAHLHMGKFSSVAQVRTLASNCFSPVNQRISRLSERPGFTG